MIALVATTLRTLTPASAVSALTVAFLAAPLSELASLEAFFCAHSAALVGRESRETILAAVSETILAIGERADRCRPGTRTEAAHLRHMAAVDRLGTALLVARAAA